MLANRAFCSGLQKVALNLIMNPPLEWNLGPEISTSITSASKYRSGTPYIFLYQRQDNNPSNPSRDHTTKVPSLPSWFLIWPREIASKTSTNGFLKSRTILMTRSRLWSLATSMTRRTSKQFLTKPISEHGGRVKICPNPWFRLLRNLSSKWAQSWRSVQDSGRKDSQDDRKQINKCRIISSNQYI